MDLTLWYLDFSVLDKNTDCNSFVFVDFEFQVIDIMEIIGS